MTKRNWQKWILNFWSMLAQHISVAGGTWLGIGIKNGKIQWDDLWVAIMMGAFFPTLWRFLGTTPLPEIEEVTISETTTKITTKTKTVDDAAAPLTDETKPTDNDKLPNYTDGLRDAGSK